MLVQQYLSVQTEQVRQEQFSFLTFTGILVGNVAKQKYLPILTQLVGISKRMRKSQSTGSTMVFLLVECAEAYIRTLQD